MTREDILRIAKEAGFARTKMHGALERFANLVAAAEREACAKVAEDMGNTDANMNKTWRNGCFDTGFAIRERGQK